MVGVREVADQIWLVSFMDWGNWRRLTRGFAIDLS
jgi:hypothetical protein